MISLQLVRLLQLHESLGLDADLLQVVLQLSADLLLCGYDEHAAHGPVDLLVFRGLQLLNRDQGDLCFG